MGFADVYDYPGGKLDWMAAGLPTEGTNPARPRAGEVARADVPTCRLDELLGSVQQRVRAAGFNACVVVNEQRVVFGLLREEELAGDPDQRIADVMRPGPSTFRPFVPVADMAEQMADQDLANAPITTSDGKLVGLLLREDVQRAPREAHEMDDA